MLTSNYINIQYYIMLTLNDINIQYNLLIEKLFYFVNFEDIISEN